MLRAVTLEAEASRLIAQLNALDRPSFEDVGPQRARKGFEEMPPSGVLVDVASTEDRTIPGPDGNDIAVRIYRPDDGAATADDSGVLGCLVYFHGGGWVVGSIETHDRTCRSLTMLAGVVSVSVDYRMAPEDPFPASPNDCCAATQWVCDNAAELGVDPQRVAIGGDSAGGNLAAAVALMCRDAAANGDACGQPALQVLIYPVTDFNRDTDSMIANAEGYLLTRATMAWFDDLYCPPSERKNPYAAPARGRRPVGSGTRARHRGWPRPAAQRRRRVRAEARRGAGAHDARRVPGPIPRFLRHDPLPGPSTRSPRDHGPRHAACALPRSGRSAPPTESRASPGVQRFSQRSAPESFRADPKITLTSRNITAYAPSVLSRAVLRNRWQTSHEPIRRVATPHAQKLAESAPRPPAAAES